MRRPATQGRHWGRVAHLLTQVDVVPISMGKNVAEQYVARRAARQVMVLGAELVMLIVIMHKKITCVGIPAATADLASTRIKMDTLEDALLVRLACTALPVH